ncbi:CBS domain-containing protein [Nitrospirota bacterium]
MDLIISHMNTDFDAFSSMVAARLLYPEGMFAFPGSQEKKLRDFIDELYPIEQVRLKDIQPSELKRVIIVDTKSPERLGPLADILERSGAEVHIYDHHEHTPGDLRGAFEKIEPVGATATIFTEILRERGIKLEPMAATILCLGIYEETGNMLFPSTTERDMEAAAWLLRSGASLRIVSTYLRTALSAEEIALLNKLTESARETVINGLKVVVSAASSEQYIGDAAHLAHRVMDTGYTDAAVILLEMEGKVVMVGRSRAPEINIADVLTTFGGGGHPTAASATVQETPLAILEEQVLEKLKESVKPGRFATDVMTSPVLTIQSSSTVKSAESTLTRYGVNALPVLDEKGMYMGIITREEVERALFHSLDEGTVEDFTTTDALTAERYTPVSVIERDMIEQNQRFVPVLEDGMVKGAITRTDLLRAMYDASLRRVGISKSKAEGRQPIEKSIVSWMCSRLPGEHCDLLRSAGEVAGAMGFRAYLVGGTVRDIIRERESGEGLEEPDIDIVIEGDGVAFARELGDRLGGRVHAHERFQTATLLTDTLKLDIASARTEYYESPAALPTVETSSLKKDLYRRDFTINALAIRLNPGEFGRLVDFFGAQRDIKERTIKVLHNLSFIEDPTRAFRAVRFAERFSFRLSKHTENLIRSALKMDLFEKLTGARLYDEMALIFAEKSSRQAISRLDHYGLLRVIHPSLAYTPEMETMLTSVEDTLSWFDLLFTEEHPERPVIYLSALLSELKKDEKDKALTRLSVPPKIREAVINSTRLARLALRKLPDGDTGHVYETLKPLSLESLLLAMALTKYDDRKKEVSRYLMEYRNVRPELKGEDLRKMGLEPGPAYSRILGQLLLMRLRGQIVSRQDEEDYVRAEMSAGKEG